MLACGYYMKVYFKNINKNFVKNLLMIFWGKIWDTIFQKVSPSFFWKNFGVKKIG